MAFGGDHDEMMDSSIAYLVLADKESTIADWADRVYSVDNNHFASHLNSLPRRS